MSEKIIPRTEERAKEDDDFVDYCNEEIEKGNAFAHWSLDMYQELEEVYTENDELKTEIRDLENEISDIQRPYYWV